MGSAVSKARDDNMLQIAKSVWHKDGILDHMNLSLPLIRKWMKVIYVMGSKNIILQIPSQKVNSTLSALNAPRLKFTKKLIVDHLNLQL